MDIAVLRLLFDFGLVILIWIVQLIIYPGLCFYTNNDLVIWHKKYTTQISYIVGPLMLGQLAIIAYQIWLDINWYTLLSLGITAVLWMLTFSIFIPLHNSVQPDKDCTESTAKLVKMNWSRTFLWTTLFLVSVWNFL